MTVEEMNHKMLVQILQNQVGIFSQLLDISDSKHECLFHMSMTEGLLSEIGESN